MTQQKADPGCALSGLLIAGIAGLSLCAKDESATNYSATEQTSNWSAGGGTAEAEYEEIDLANVRRVGKTAATIVKLGIDGADRVFSENCFDGVREAFSWAKLDRCGAFDAIASRWAADLTYDSTAYFSSESAAGRYLELAGKHQADSALIDQRWENIQAATAAARQPVTTSTTPPSNVGLVMNEIDSIEVASDQPSTVDLNQL